MASQQAVDEIAEATDEFLGKIEKKPIGQQILIGAASGLVTGYVLSKIGKSIAFCIGVTAVGAQFFMSRRRTKTDWKKVESDARKALQTVIPTTKQDNAILQKIIAVLKENQVFFGSFGGGFLIGVSFA
ncbi:unnamed protein product [Hymenolepis diminuta]|uniref:FUN14 domain-containing protein n=1 Tax=Hymenolepis diminuta TaxID=6216 RepID=A0A564YYA4_HYMDI|nr:unnamed protein product [Hymenolepis diminuta]